ncbi:uncharacterized protein B0P05DRAFT_557359 [Gilbertella persicaria]|uniref:Uncharacterized protein n=1 Tax=Rhizopus stolonifer TaxID=4846 RepID=A0A367KRV6_RHIST|nr:uncharacterized protein B0P05DRAFT_557359 [Gilbertella persicaria]KAI8061515.1 hypothetical protein B0P05DRAFT_557359 [Gilbertella persicaria]RCI04870.1 hypothetical protein CU098_006223 [Rhizopus stolonifer]
MRLATAVWIAFPLATVAMGATVKNLVVFGDSNSDVGNGQRWSEGPNWSEYLALGWNASLYSFAFSGSVCDTRMYESISSQDRVPSLRDQLEAYYTLGLNLKPEETVYAFWLGVQDVFEMTKRHGRQEPEYKEITDCIGQQLRAARKVFLSDRFLVLNLPPFEHMPYYQEDQSSLNKSQAAVEINRGLEKDVANLNKHHHALEMDYVDIHSLINDIIVDPSVFNFKEPLEPYLDTCYGKPDCTFNSVDYIWWDQTHFTSGFHKSIAQSIIDAESYIPKVELTEQLEEKLQNPKSKFRSKKYTVKPFKGIVDEQARLYDIQKSKPIQPQQPPLEDDLDPTMFAKDEHNTYIGLLAFFLTLGGIIAWIKFPHVVPFNWIRNRDRGKFIPVRNEEV